MSENAPSTWSDILKRRQRSNFVGRDDEINQFEHNLGYPLDDERRRFIFNVYGPSGVGKTWLLRRRFCQIVEQRGWLTAYTDESQESMPQVLAHLAQQLAQQGHPLKTFMGRRHAYRQYCAQIEADPQAPQGFRPSLRPLLIKSSGQSVRRRSSHKVSQQRPDVRLRKLLVDGLNKEELRTLCSDLKDVDYDDLPAEGKAAQARELVDYLKRRDRLSDLITTGKLLRPDLDWEGQSRTAASRLAPLSDTFFEEALAVEAALEWEDEFVTYVKRTLVEPEAVKLVLEPVEILTPLFL